MIAFTATSSLSYERFVVNCIGKPKVLKFKSEYELVTGVSPIQEPNIVSCSDDSNKVVRAFEDINKLYESKPIIVIYNPE